MFYIQKMPISTDDYFRYFATSPDMDAWGLAVTATGRAYVQGGVRYPLAEHPSDHMFGWPQGRVLDALQIVLITHGCGSFETAESGLQKITSGTAFALLPGVWHRYRPDRDSGWAESWLEVRGPLVERLIKTGVFAKKSCVRSGVLACGMEGMLNHVHALSRNGPPGFSAPRAAAALAVLAAWERAGREQGRSVSRLMRAVGEAECFLSEHYAEAIDIRELAVRMGIAYSHFRRAFKGSTGFSPWQYVLHLRLSHARRLLSSSDMTLDEIAVKLGFSSGFHLSSAFKRCNGLSPRTWRRKLDNP